jgi:hypothetical protein
MLEGTANYYVRPVADAVSVVPAIRAAVREIDPTLPLIDLHTQDEQIERLTSEERLFARLAGCFGSSDRRGPHGSPAPLRQAG